MDSNKKIILSFGALILVAGLGFWAINSFEKDGLTNLPLPSNKVSLAPSTTSAPQVSLKPSGIVNVVDDAINSFVADVQFESSVFEEEFVSLNQTVLLETQAVNDFGQIYNQNEL